MARSMFRRASLRRRLYFGTPDVGMLRDTVVLAIVSDCFSRVVRPLPGTAERGAYLLQVTRTRLATYDCHRLVASSQGRVFSRVEYTSIERQESSHS